MSKFDSSGRASNVGLTPVQVKVWQEANLGGLGGPGEVASQGSIMEPACAWPLTPGRRAALLPGYPQAACRLPAAHPPRLPGLHVPSSSIY